MVFDVLLFNFNDFIYSVCFLVIYTRLGANDIATNGESTL